MTDAPIEKNPAYEVGTCVPGDLSRAELKTCFAIIEEGEAVDFASMKRDLPRAGVLAVVRTGAQIVGVGAIKPVRKGYAAKVARNSGVKFPAETPELGYVAVDTAHRRQGLSHRIMEALLSKYEGRLFATTYDKRMKRTFENAGFVKKGKQWNGREHVLSYWERGADAPKE